jgi:hypothetical protein
MFTGKQKWHARRIRRIIDRAALRVVTRTAKEAKVVLIVDAMDEKELVQLVTSAYRLSEGLT